MKITMVPHSDDAMIHEVIGQFLSQQILDDGRYFVEDIVSYIKSGVCNLWLISDGDERCAATVTMFVNYPRRTDLIGMFLLGRKMSEWRDQLVDVLSDFAASNNCKYIHIGGRRGWVKRLERYGFEHKYVNVQKAVQ